MRQELENSDKNEKKIVFNKFKNFILLLNTLLKGMKKFSTHFSFV